MSHSKFQALLGPLVIVLFGPLIIPIVIILALGLVALG